MPESVESAKFISHRARMSGNFDSRKDLHLAIFEWRSQIFVKLSFRELCDSKLSGLRPFDNIAIIHWVKNSQKQKIRQWVNETLIVEVIVVTLTENSSKTTPVFLTADGEASWSLFPSSVYSLSRSLYFPSIKDEIKKNLHVMIKQSSHSSNWVYTCWSSVEPWIYKNFGTKNIYNKIKPTLNVENRL